jgi:hypothetical protein
LVVLRDKKVVKCFIDFYNLLACNIIRNVHVDTCFFISLIP